MIVSNLELINFRNYKNIKVSFSEGINLIVGSNAVGKTNLVESIYYLSFARSFKTLNDNELININSDFAQIETKINHNDIKINIDSNGKRIFINNNKIKKVSELSKYTNILLFTPKDVLLFKDAPKNRRFFLNSTLSKENISYQNFIIKYEQILKERNLELKKEKPDLNLIDIYTTQLIDVSYFIYKERLSFINRLNVALKEIYKNISQDNKNIEIKYFSLINDLVNFKTLAQKMYKSSLKEDLSKQVTTKGIHKEDFTIYLNNKDIGKFGSQGENRMAILSLKLAPYLLIQDITKKPIVILDDVLSELDENHKNLLIQYLKNFKQVFITATKVHKEITKNIYLIQNDQIVKED